MSIILGSLLLGITYLANVVGAVPSEEETVISQLARTVFDARGFMYLATLAATTTILVMAIFPFAASLAAYRFLRRWAFD